MLTQRKLSFSLALALFAASASAGSLVYVVTDSQQFGTVDLATGVFRQIGHDTPQPQASLVLGPGGSLFSLTFSGDLESINPATGATSVIGATGLGFAVDLAGIAGTLYATDSSGNLYTVNPATGATQLIGPTGIPAVPSNPADQFEESLYGVGGKLYATFDAFTVDPTTLNVTQVIAPALYQIDPSTGATTLVASTDPLLLASVDVNGTFYAFKGVPSGPFTFSGSQVYTLDAASGNTSFVTDIGSPATGILGAAPGVPEPASMALAGTGIVAILVLRRRKLAPED
jgi:hypothetical protein